MILLRKELQKLRLGKVELYLLERIEERGCIHIALLDPLKTKLEEAGKLARLCEESGSDAIMVGGSTVFSQNHMDLFIQEIKSKVSIPVIIFPNNIQSISRYADAIWFMSLLNSVDWYFIVGAQMQGALSIKAFGLEAIPMGYLVFGGDTAVAAMGRVLPLPTNKPEVVVCYGLAAQYLGMRFLYLEAGSGAEKPIPPEVIKAVSENVSIPVIVGGGIRTPEAAEHAVKAGAQAIVTGTAVEQDTRRLSEIVAAIHKADKT
ncbi:MAG TPA: geranylgeranylglyceryl/heptaprenylglyceryl phosphate synthase [Candidatus Caldiarchaeum subterraneum]|uniref:Geranylgeranylglyceryl phosphate synthase n=1 Tax=Caldiarchaeum subterraneum TaxID=311458 RepID=A0A832ZU04_CALS0|nr:geranylgeranylglyceryl/heptaprenylglyceryl phosphate synthase [Candidatus Caldarchaeum subterraneum]